MPGHVGQGLLGDAETRGLDLGSGAEILWVGEGSGPEGRSAERAARTYHASAATSPRSSRIEGRRSSAMPRTCSRAFATMATLIHQPLGPVLAAPPPHLLEVNLEGSQGLAKFVVQLAGDPPPLVLLGTEQLP